MLAIGCRSARSIGCYQREPTIAEILSDSITKAVMRADGVDPDMLALELRNMAQTLRPPLVE